MGDEEIMSYTAVLNNLGCKLERVEPPYGDILVWVYIFVIVEKRSDE